MHTFFPKIIALSAVPNPARVLTFDCQRRRALSQFERQRRDRFGQGQSRHLVITIEGYCACQDRRWVRFGCPLGRRNSPAEASRRRPSYSYTFDIQGGSRRRARGGWWRPRPRGGRARRRRARRSRRARIEGQCLEAGVDDGAVRGRAAHYRRPDKEARLEGLGRLAVAVTSVGRISARGNPT